MRKRKRLVLKKWIRVTLLIIFIILFIFSSFQILMWKKDGENTKKIEEKLINDVKPKERKAKDENVEIINPPEDKNNDYWNYIKMDMINANFSELK